MSTDNLFETFKTLKSQESPKIKLLLKSWVDMIPLYNINESTLT